ncbi:transposase family protein [Streptomyces griseoincarnatus]
MLACWFGVDRSTITRAIAEVRPLLAERGGTISPGVRLRTLAEVIYHLGASGKTGIIDGTEIRVRRPAAGRKDRDKFISGKNKQNAVKTMVVTDGDGRVLFCSPTKPGSCADITHPGGRSDGPACRTAAMMRWWSGGSMLSSVPGSRCGISITARPPTCPGIGRAEERSSASCSLTLSRTRSATASSSRSARTASSCLASCSSSSSSSARRVVIRSSSSGSSMH